MKDNWCGNTVTLSAVSAAAPLQDTTSAAESNFFFITSFHPFSLLCLNILIVYIASHFFDPTIRQGEESGAIANNIYLGKIYIYKMDLIDPELGRPETNCHIDRPGSTHSSPLPLHKDIHRERDSFTTSVSRLSFAIQATLACIQWWCRRVYLFCTLGPSVHRSHP